MRKVFISVFTLVLIYCCTPQENPDPGIPSVSTGTVTNITTTTATCSGDVTSEGGSSITARGVCWSTTQNPTTANSKTTDDLAQKTKAEDGSGLGTYTSNITDLSPNTTYFVRAYATNSIGTAYGEQRTFTTNAEQKTLSVTTGEIINITTATAACSGNVTSDGGHNILARGVCWSTTEKPTILNSKTTNGTGLGTYTSNMTGLSPNTAYYVRAYVMNSEAIAYGEQKTFTTSVEEEIPTVTTSEVSNVTTTTADCLGNVTADGGLNVTARGVCWSTSQNPTILNSKTTNETGLGTFTGSITGLTPNTTYYVRAYATNSKGTAYGEQKFFTTLFQQEIPTVVTSEIAVIATTSATCYGNVTADGGLNVTERGVCWSTSQNPTILNSKTTNGTGLGTYTSNTTGLSPNTTYYVRAYATNLEGTAYGLQKVFTTRDSGQNTSTVGGIILDNTTLSINDSPYSISTDVQIAKDATLTIEPGVLIYGNHKYIKLWGTLSCIGAENSMITLEDVKLNIDYSSNDTQRYYIQYSIINEGEIMLPYGSGYIRDSKLTDVKNYLYFWGPRNDSYIERNIFIRCEKLTAATHNDDVELYIRNNVFYAPTSYAIYYHYNRFNSRTIVEYNSFLSTNKIAIYLPSGNIMDNNIVAINNYWNTTDANVINTMIYDKNDDLGIPYYVEYNPILTEPHPNTPVFNP